MAQVLDEALNAVEALQKPGPAGQTGNMIFCVARPLQATSLPSNARLAEQISRLPESS